MGGARANSFCVWVAFLGKSVQRAEDWSFREESSCSCTLSRSVGSVLAWERTGLVDSLLFVRPPEKLQSLSLRLVPFGYVLIAWTCVGTDGKIRQADPIHLLVQCKQQ